jgi:hypothetical protein
MLHTLQRKNRKKGLRLTRAPVLTPIDAQTGALPD